MKNSLIATVVAASVFGATAASAVTVYKVTDANGHVTYQNAPPRIGDVARTERKEINPNENIMVNERRAVGTGTSGGGNRDQVNLRALDELIRRSLAAAQASNPNAPAIVNSGINARRLEALGVASGSAPNQGGIGTGELMTADNGTAFTGSTANNTQAGLANTTGTASGGTTSNFGGTTSNYGGTTSNYGGTTSNFGVGTGANTADGSAFGSGSTGGNTTSAANGLSTNNAPGTTVFPNGMNTDIGGVSSGSTTAGTSTFGTTTGTTTFGADTTMATTGGNTNSTANFGNTGPIAGTQGSNIPSPSTNNTGAGAATFGTGANGTGSGGAPSGGTAAR